MDDPAAAPPPDAGGVWPAFLPSSYIEEPRLRIQAYRQLAGVLTRIRGGGRPPRNAWRDRFGRLPEAAENLLALHALASLLAASRRLQQVELRGGKLMLTRGADFVLVNGRFPRLTSTEPVSRMRELFSLLETLINLAAAEFSSLFSSLSRVFPSMKKRLFVPLVLAMPSLRVRV